MLAAGTATALAEAGPAGGDVRPLPPGAEEQQIEVLHPGASQTLSQAEPGDAEQEVGVPQPKSPAQRTASTVGKVVLGVVAAAVALGMAAASLLLL